MPVARSGLTTARSGQQPDEVIEISSDSDDNDDEDEKGDDVESIGASGDQASKRTVYVVWWGEVSIWCVHEQEACLTAGL